MTNHRSLIALNLAVFLFMLGVGVIVPLLPQKIITLTGSLTTIGYLASAFAIPFVLLQLPIGRLSNRFGFRYLLLTGYLVGSISGVIYYFSNNQWMIFFGRLLQGIGEAPLWALAPALLSILYPLARGKVIGFYNASIHLGLTLGSVVSILTSKIWVNNEPYLLFALAGTLGALLILMGVQDPLHRDNFEKTPIDAGTFKNLVKDPGTLAVFSSIALYGAGYGIFLTILPGFLIQNKGFSRTEISCFFTLFYIAISLSQVITGPISDRQGRRPIMVSGLIAASVGLAIFPDKKGWEIFPWLFLASFGLGIFCVSALAWLNDSVSDSFKGTISCAFYLFWGIGFFSAPLFLGKPAMMSYGFKGFHLLALLFLIQAFLLGIIPHKRGEIPRKKL